MSESADRVSSAIRNLRKDCSMTQVEFAAALGVVPTSIHRWEAGSSIPEFEMVISLWSLAIERGSATSKEFADFLLSRTSAIQPLFDAVQLPDIKALDQTVASLSVDQRRLVLAFIEMLRYNTDQTANEVMRLLLEPWRQRVSKTQTSQHPFGKGIKRKTTKGQAQ